MSSKSAVATAIMRPVVSLARLTLLLVTTGMQVEFLQQQDILPTVGTCHKCQAMINSDFKTGA